MFPSYLCAHFLGFISSASRKKQRTPSLEDDFEEEAEIMPQTKSARQINLEKKKAAGSASGSGKKTVVKKPKTVSFAKMPDREYRAYRQKNPYLVPRQDNVMDPRFYTNDQELVYNQIYSGQRNAVVLQHRLNIAHMTSPKHVEYFAEAFSMCEEFGLLPIMEVHQDYNEELVAQFYATVHLGTGANPQLHWMIKNEHVDCKWSEFCHLLGYPRAQNNNGWTVHHLPRPSAKDVLEPITMPGGTPGQSEDLIPTYEIMFRIFRETLTPRVGNWDQEIGRAHV